MQLDLSAWLALSHGDRIALSAEGDPGTLSYRELDRLATGWAEKLEGMGVGPGDRVSLLAPPGPRSVALLLGCLKVGAALVPHNLRATPSEIAGQLERIQPRLLLQDPSVQPPEGLPFPTAPFDDPPPGGEGGKGRTPPQWETPALILFTGGSTGTPKGAVLSLRQLLTNSVQTIVTWRLGPQDSTLVVYPLFHTGGWNVLTLPLLVAGGHVALLPRWDPARALSVLERPGVTVFSAVPSMLGDLASLPEFSSARFPTLRWVKSGGGTSPPWVVDAFRSKGVPFYQGYGLTEAGPNLFYSDPEDLSHPTTVGRPGLFSDLRLVDEKGDDANAGELLVAGPLLFSGYHGDPEETRATRVGAYFRTGDILRRDGEGFFYFVGRRKLMYKSGGENVYPTEVEDALESHPSIAEAAVVGVPDPKWGEAGLAFYRSASPLPDDEIREFLRSRLAHYKVPREFLRVPAIPRTPAGKKDYPRLLREVPR